jgi:hypothetical protein
VTEPPIAVLDASVLVPRWSRLVLQHLAAARPPRYTAVWSTAIVAETWRILTEQRLRAGDAPAAISRDAHRMHARLDPVMTIVECWRRPADAPLSPLPDRHDEHLWNAALNAGARYIVSHNVRDFPPVTSVIGRGADQASPARRHLAHTVEFLTAIEFIDDVLGENAALLYGQALPSEGVVRSRRSG